MTRSRAHAVGIVTGPDGNVKPQPLPPGIAYAELTARPEVAEALTILATPDGGWVELYKPDNDAQTARNLRRTLRNAAAGARLIQADGWTAKSAADDSSSLADALDELHRLKRRLDRRIKRGASRASTLPHITTSEASRAAY
jgi:hypothetical protein